MKLKVNLLLLLSLFVLAVKAAQPLDYVSTLVGTQSKHSLSTGNTYPAIALPWGMNFWTPQTGKMGDGWAYTYDADKIRVLNKHINPALGSTITVSFQSCLLLENRFLMKISVPVGFHIRLKSLNHIIIVCIWQTMM